MTTPLNKNYWAETESLSAETDTSHLNKTKPRDRDFTCGAETVKIGYSAEMTSNRPGHTENTKNVIEVTFWEISDTPHSTGPYMSPAIHYNSSCLEFLFNHHLFSIAHIW